MADIVDDLADLHRQATHEPSHYYAAKTAERAIREIERLRAALKEADKLLEVAYYAHQKMGLEGCGNHGLSHEVRMFAMHFSQPEMPKGPGHTILSGDGRYWRFRLRDHEQKEDKTNG